MSVNKNNSNINLDKNIEYFLLIRWLEYKGSPEFFPNGVKMPLAPVNLVRI